VGAEPNTVAGKGNVFRKFPIPEGASGDGKIPSPKPVPADPVDKIELVDRAGFADESALAGGREVDWPAFLIGGIGSAAVCGSMGSGPASGKAIQPGRSGVGAFPEVAVASAIPLESLAPPLDAAALVLA
jgi:hypothetical protein